MKRRLFASDYSLFFVLVVVLAAGLDLEPWWLDLGVFLVAWIGARFITELVRVGFEMERTG